MTTAMPVPTTAVARKAGRARAASSGSGAAEMCVMKGLAVNELTIRALW